MGIRVECDWCRQAIAAGTSYITVEVDGKISGKSVSAPARVYCGFGGDSCARRLLGVLEGNPIGRADMGFEWQLVSIVAPEAPATEPAANVPAPRAPIDPNESVRFGGADITAELHEFIRSRVAPSYKFALPRAGIVSIEQAAAMSDYELLALKGVGGGMVMALREWIIERGGYDGLTLAREVYELLRDRSPKVDQSDPMYPVLAEMVPVLAEALGAEVAS